MNTKMQIPGASKPAQMAHDQFRLIEISSTWTYALNDETNQWEEKSSDARVTDKFNKWAEVNNVNPVSHSLIPTHHYSNEGKTLTIRHTLTAAVISRVSQARMELAYRSQMLHLAASLTSPSDAPRSASPAPAPSIPTGTAPVSSPSPPTPGDDPLRPVNVGDIGDEVPKVPS